MTGFINRILLKTEIIGNNPFAPRGKNFFHSFKCLIKFYILQRFGVNDGAIFSIIIKIFKFCYVCSNPVLYIINIMII